MTAGQRIATALARGICAMLLVAPPLLYLWLIDAVVGSVLLAQIVSLIPLVFVTTMLEQGLGTLRPTVGRWFLMWLAIWTACWIGCVVARVNTLYLVVLFDTQSFSDAYRWLEEVKSNHLTEWLRWVHGLLLPMLVCPGVGHAHLVRLSQTWQWPKQRRALAAQAAFVTMLGTHSALTVHGNGAFAFGLSQPSFLGAVLSSLLVGLVLPEAFAGIDRKIQRHILMAEWKRAAEREP